MTACVAVFVQGQLTLEIEGNLLAGATAVHQIKFGAFGNVQINTKDLLSKPHINFDPRHPTRNCGDKPNCFHLDQPTSAWRVEAFGEMNAKFGVKMGPVISVMVTPGLGALWFNAFPWVAAEASMYGSMKYEQSRPGSNGHTISDDLL